MQVETYEVNEATSDGEVDQLDEAAVALIEKMGLAGQRQLISSGPGKVVSLLPYQMMTDEELAVYGLLFPQHDKIGDYRAGPLPLRVLQVAALAIDREWFARLEVWHKTTGAAKEDPLLIGVAMVEVQPGNRQWMREVRYLLARWGDALVPYASLVTAAAAIARTRLGGAIATSRQEIETAAAQVQHLSDGQACRWAMSGGPVVMGNSAPR